MTIIVKKMIIKITMTMVNDEGDNDDGDDVALFA